jgi:hypothetical protein
VSDYWPDDYFPADYFGNRYFGPDEEETEEAQGGWPRLYGSYLDPEEEEALTLILALAV